MSIEISFRVNGGDYTEAVEPRLTLADLLRDRLDLTGTHLGCEHGVCGACTVLVDGASARACLTLAVQVDGAEVTTIEGIADGDQWHPVQVAMKECQAFQCGFCTPGFIITAVEFLAGNPAPTEAQVRDAISGNVCRCSGYEPIVDGILKAAGSAR